MKKLLIVIVLFVIGYGLFFVAEGGTKNLVSPNFNQNKIKSEQIPEATPVPPVTPKTFKFDSSTDLKAELEKVNPKVDDADFN